MNKLLNGEEKRISDIIIPRILQYLRAIQQLEKDGKTSVSSEDIAKSTNINAFQVRKDLANFGKFGQPGTGYDISKLKGYLLDIIFAGKPCRIIIVGTGNLGSALLHYGGFESEGMKFVAAFDADQANVGKTYGNVTVEHADGIKSGLNSRADIAIITVPAASAQKVADKLVSAGITSILNFAPATIYVPKGVTLRNVDLSIELQALRYFSLQ